MPEMTGFELYQKINKIQKGIKVCFITSFTSYYSSLIERSESICFIQKPISIDKLVIRLKSEMGINEK